MTVKSDDLIPLPTGEVNPSFEKPKTEKTILENDLQIPTDILRRHYGFTKKQAEVVNAVLTGKPYKIIADEMFIAEGSVKFHLTDIFKKLNVSNRVEMFYKLIKECPKF